MKCYLSLCFAGFIALDEDYILVDYEFFSRRRITERLIEIQNNNLCKEESIILKRLVKNYDEIVIETSLPHSRYESLKYNNKFTFKTPHNGGNFLRSNLVSILQETGFTSGENDLNLLIHEVSQELTKHRLNKALESEDLLLIQAIDSIEEMDELISKMVERLREWYSIHFPELDVIKGHELYVKLVAEYGDKDSIINSEMLNSELNIDERMGASIGQVDILMLKDLADSLMKLQKTRKSLTLYIDDKMKELAPNLRDLTGASLGAKLIAHVGGLKRLSLLSSGTIQVLGAEKALFRHLKTGERPPKHGLIYQHPMIRSAKWWLRGKIARALASKISLAVRVDVFSGEFSPEIKNNFNQKVENIEKANPFPKKPKKSLKSDKKKIKKKKKDKYKKKFKQDYY